MAGSIPSLSSLAKAAGGSHTPPVPSKRSRTGLVPPPPSCPSRRGGGPLRRSLGPPPLAFPGARPGRAGAATAGLEYGLRPRAGVVAFVLPITLYRRMNERPHPRVLNGPRLICAAIALLPAAVALEGAPHIVWTAQVSWSLAYLVVVLSVGASMLWFWILQHGEASRVSAYFFVTPVFGLLLSAVLLGEQLTGRDGVALVVIATGLWLAARA